MEVGAEGAEAGREVGEEVTEAVGAGLLDGVIVAERVEVELLDLEVAARF